MAVPGLPDGHTGVPAGRGARLSYLAGRLCLADEAVSWREERRAARA
jgi:hypothetical protein